VGVYITSEDEKNYTVAFEDPINVEGVNEEAIVAATGKQIDALERLIRAHPKLWFWCHKRWKGEYKEIYSA
jgi:KDO2-lipid IV(A) lauroyltransferase